MSEILSGQRQALAGIDVLRKICNHPDLLQRTQAQGSVTYGEPSRCVLGQQTAAGLLVVFPTGIHAAAVCKPAGSMLGWAPMHAFTCWNTCTCAGCLTRQHERSCQGVHCLALGGVVMQHQASSGGCAVVLFLRRASQDV